MPFASIQVAALVGLIVLVVFSVRTWLETRHGKAASSHAPGLKGWLYVAGLMVALAVLAVRGRDTTFFVAAGIMVLWALFAAAPFVWALGSALVRADRIVWTSAHPSGASASKCESCGAQVVVAWGPPGTCAYKCEKCGATVNWQ